MLPIDMHRIIVYNTDVMRGEALDNEEDMKMMYLTNRNEIAAAMNFGEYPVLTINLENRPYEGSDYARGCRVRVAWDSSERRYAGMTTHGNLYIENGRFEISSEGACLSASFGYRDVMEMAAEANVPVVHRGQVVVVIMEIPSRQTCMVHMMRVSERINIHCSTVCHLEEINEEGAAEIRQNLRRILNR